MMRGRRYVPTYDEAIRSAQEDQRTGTRTAAVHKICDRLRYLDRNWICGRDKASVDAQTSSPAEFEFAHNGAAAGAQADRAGRRAPASRCERSPLVAAHHFKFVPEVDGQVRVGNDGDLDFACLSEPCSTQSWPCSHGRFLDIPGSGLAQVGVGMPA